VWTFWTALVKARRAIASYLGLKGGEYGVGDFLVLRRFAQAALAAAGAVLTKLMPLIGTTIVE